MRARGLCQISERRFARFEEVPGDGMPHWLITDMRGQVPAGPALLGFEITLLDGLLAGQPTARLSAVSQALVPTLDWVRAQLRSDAVAQLAVVDYLDCQIRHLRREGTPGKWGEFRRVKPFPRTLPFLVTRLRHSFAVLNASALLPLARRKRRPQSPKQRAPIESSLWAGSRARVFRS